MPFVQEEPAGLEAARRFHRKRAAAELVVPAPRELPAAGLLQVLGVRIGVQVRFPDRLLLLSLRFPELH